MYGWVEDDGFCIRHALIHIIQEHKACRDTQRQAQFPCQEEGAGTRATLTVLGELDVEKQEPTTDDTRSQAQQYGHKHFYGKILIVERNELRRSYQYQAHNHLAFQVGIGKDVFFSKILLKYAE